MRGQTLHFEIRRNRPHAGASLVPKLRACSTRFRKAVAAGDARGMAKESDRALALMTSLFDLLRGEHDAERLHDSWMEQVSGFLAKDLAPAERLAMIRDAKLDRAHSHYAPMTLRDALNKIAHCDAARSTYRIDGRGAHYLVLSGPDQKPDKKGPWVAEILISTLCRNAAAAIGSLSA